MKEFNCPNCGAPIITDVCKYCGTVFLDFAAIQANKPSYIKFKVDDPNDSSISNIYLMKLTVDELEFKISSDTINTVDYKNKILAMAENKILEVNLHGYVTSNGNEPLVTVIREEDK